MSAALWMLLVVVMPGGIGAVVYFLLRQPVMIRCPSCNTELAAGLHFCPQCRFQVAPVCGQCFRGVQITDAFCPQCGHDVSRTRPCAAARLQRQLKVAGCQLQVASCMKHPIVLPAASEADNGLLQALE